MKKALALSMALAMSAAMLAGCGGSGFLPPADFLLMSPFPLPALLPLRIALPPAPPPSAL